MINDEDELSNRYERSTVELAKSVKPEAVHVPPAPTVEVPTAVVSHLNVTPVPPT